MSLHIQLDISSRTERHPALHTLAWPKFSPFSVTASLRRGFGHRARPIWRPLIISYAYIWKGEFTKTNQTIDAVKANITDEIQAVTSDVLARIFQNMARRVQSCLDANGGHMLWCRHISYTMSNILISGKMIKEILGSVTSWTQCIWWLWTVTAVPLCMVLCGTICSLSFVLCLGS